MAALDFFTLSVQVERAVTRHERNLRSFEAEESPLELHRAVSGVKTLEALAASSPSAIEVPLAEGVTRFVTWLLAARLSYPAERALVLARRVPRVHLPAGAVLLAGTTGEGDKLSWDDAWATLLRSDGPTAEAWMQALADVGHEIASAVRERRDRVGEVIARVAEKTALSDTKDYARLGRPLPAAQSRALAEAVLSATEDVAAEAQHLAAKDGSAVMTTEPTAARGILALLARETASDFPARISGTFLESLFGAYTRGLDIRFALPPFVAGAASFARALGAFGFGLRRAVESRELPFVLRRDPSGLEAERFGAVFGALAGDEAFARRALGLGQRRARDHARALGCTALADARRRAARVLLAFDESRFEELTARVFGAPFPSGLAGAWPSPWAHVSAVDATRLVAAIDAVAIRRTLVEDFDEDWFRNPRTYEWLRMRGATPPTAETTQAEDTARNERGAMDLARSFEAILA